MIAVTYRCPNTRLVIDEWVADAVCKRDGYALYEAVICRACNRIHLVNLSTGTVLAASTLEATR